MNRNDYRRMQLAGTITFPADAAKGRIAIR